MEIQQGSPLRRTEIQMLSVTLIPDLDHASVGSGKTIHGLFRRKPALESLYSSA